MDKGLNYLHTKEKCNVDTWIVRKYGKTSMQAKKI